MDALMIHTFRVQSAGAVQVCTDRKECNWANDTFFDIIYYVSINFQFLRWQKKKYTSISSIYTHDFFVPTFILMIIFSLW